MGRSKICTIVPSNHFGPIPGLEVGTMWMFRVQVSEHVCLFVKLIFFLCTYLILHCDYYNTFVKCEMILLIVNVQW